MLQALGTERDISVMLTYLHNLTSNKWFDYQYRGVYPKGVVRAISQFSKSGDGQIGHLGCIFW